MNKQIKYSKAIHEAFTYLLENHDEFFVIGQGLWSPWYVGETMKDLDKKFGKSRVIDTPVSVSMFIIALWIGAAPLHLGNKDACTLTNKMLPIFSILVGKIFP